MENILRHSACLSISSGARARVRLTVFRGAAAGSTCSSARARARSSNRFSRCGGRFNLLKEC